MSIRQVEVVVVSDVHLGTYASKAKEFTQYLKSIAPRLLILNGDIIDGWQFSKRFFPKEHIAAIKEIFNKLTTGTRVIYVTGNHDDLLRRYTDLELGNFSLVNKAAIEINGRKTWIFHGDVFDHTTTGQAKFWVKLGSNGYALLMAFNKLINFICRPFGKEKLSLSQKIMEQFHKKIVRIDEFEEKIATLAIEKDFDNVICGHIHQPQKRTVKNERGVVNYLNSGDWVENLSALEYYDNDWHIYTHKEKAAKVLKMEHSLPPLEVVTNEISYFFNSLSKTQ